MPISLIHYLLRNNCFSEVADLLEEYPNEARSLNSARSAPIAVLLKSMTQGTVYLSLQMNVARYVDGVQAAFHALLTAYPLAVENVDKRGDTALIIACRDGLISDRTDNTAKQILRWTVERMIDACPSAVSIPDAMGKFPLDHVCHLGFGPMDIITKLARVYPDALIKTSPRSHGNDSILNRMVDIDLLWDRVGPLLEICPNAAKGSATGFNSNPIQTLWYRIKFKYQDEVRPSRDFGGYNLTNQEISDIARRMNTTDDGNTSFYNRAKNVLFLLLKAAYYGTTAQQDDGDFVFRPLHAAAGLCIPADVVLLLTELFPNTNSSQYLGQVDDNGWCPLHVAAAGPFHSRGSGAIDTPTGIEILVKKYPAAARMLDVNGKLPLHLALEHDKLWHLGIEPLVSAAPLTLRVVNGASGLYPFQDAAMINRGMSTLTTVFSLLRADPTVLALARHC